MASTAKKRQKTAPVLMRLLRKHFDCDPAELPVVEYQLNTVDRPNLHLAIEELFSDRGRVHELVGILSLDEYQTASLGRLTRESSAKRFERGPVEFIDVPLPGGRQLSCVKNGLYLIRERDTPMALLVSLPRHSHPQRIQVEVMAAEREQAERFVAELQRLTLHGNAYRGHVLSVEQDCFQNMTIRHHALPLIRREELILPEKLLQRIERHTLAFSKHSCTTVRGPASEAGPSASWTAWDWQNAHRHLPRFPNAWADCHTPHRSRNRLH